MSIISIKLHRGKKTKTVSFYDYTNPRLNSLQKAKYGGAFLKAQFSINRLVSKGWVIK